MWKLANPAVIGGSAFALLLVVIIALLVRDSGGLTESQTKTVIAEVLTSYREQAQSDPTQRTSGDLSGIVDDPRPLRNIEVYVDRSLSMKPYLQADAATFHTLISTLDDLLESQVSFHGFGYRNRTDQEQTIERTRATQLRTASAYTFANNDYASLIQQFRQDGSTRLIITDGVQSDPTGGARLAAVAEELHQWVQAGGTFALFLYRTAYRGQYYTDLPGPSPRYDCDNRPLSVFILAPSSDAIDDLRGLWGPALEPDHEVRISGRDLRLEPVAEVKREDERRGLRVLRDVDAMVAEGYRSVYTATVSDASGDAYDGFVPLPFEATIDLTERPWSALGEAATRRFIQELRPSLFAWSIQPRALDDAIRARSEPGDEAGSETSPPALPSGITPVDVFQNDAPEPVITEGTSEGTLSVRYVVPVRRPSYDARKYALLLTFSPDGASARALVPSSYSTDDDRPPSQCSRILKLQRLVGTIMLRNYTPGQVLLLVDWR